MAKVIFYFVVLLFGIGGLAYLYGRPGAVATTSAATLAPASAPVTVIPEEVYGKYGKLTFVELQTLSAKTLQTWDANEKANRGLDDGEVEAMQLSLQRAGQASQAPAAQALVDKLQAKLEQRRRAWAAAAETRRVAGMADQRAAFAGTLERSYLSKGMDVTVTTGGSKNTTITLSYVLMGRPTVYQLANDDQFLFSLTSIGFTKVVFTDGYDSTWRLDLVKGKFI